LASPRQSAERSSLDTSTITWLEAKRTRPNYSTDQALMAVLGADLDTAPSCAQTAATEEEYRSGHQE
jgi:transcriptional regulator with XRE-family HTH domain